MGIPYEESGCSERGDASADEVCICFVRIARKEGMMIGGGVNLIWSLDSVKVSSCQQK